MSEEDDLAFKATVNFAAMAAVFVTEPETWPVFVAYVRAKDCEIHDAREWYHQEFAHRLVRLAELGSQPSDG
jgi:hypothetical protein